MSRASRRPRPVTPRSLTTTVVAVAGMTCRTCERRIERHVAQIPGVERVSASAVHGRVDVVTSDAVSDAALAEAIEAAGYRVGRDRWLSTDRRVWLTALAGVAVVAAIVMVASATGFTEAAAGAGNLAEGGLVVALLLGLAAGVSTCLALTGGLVLALSAAFAARNGADDDVSIIQRLRPSAVFVTGRIVGFAALGALLGALGASVALPPMVVATLMIAVAVLMTVLGVRLTGLSPRIAAWSPTLPAGIGRRLGADAGAVTAYSDTRAAALGVATFFLPCGFTQAVQVYALSTGSPLTAGAIMAVFAIGTAPGLLALGGLPSLVPSGARPALLRVVGVVVLAFALVNATAGLRLAGVTPTLSTASGPVAAPVITMEDGVQILRTFQLASGYMPADASLYAGVPTRWIVESLEAGSCAVFLQVPSLGLSVTLRPGDNAIDLPPLEPGRIAYSCSMGMYGGSLTVVERQQGVLAGAPTG
jgi:sulfite exporter TauE/SafE/copper chaperone CopZ